MIFLVAFMEFIAFPERKDSLLLEQGTQINVESTGSMGLYHHGKCHQTYPNNTIVSDEKLDWCSTISKSNDDKPWISYNLNKKAMRLTGFSIRNGCCHYLCCCITDNSVVDYDCCCRLYSYSLQGSNDNKTWKTIYKIESDDDIFYCQFKTYEFPLTESFNFVRIILDEEYPGCPSCLQINQLQLYGETIDSSFGSPASENEDEDESISIIGKIRKNEDN